MKNFGFCDLLCRWAHQYLVYVHEQIPCPTIMGTNGTDPILHWGTVGKFRTSSLLPDHLHSELMAKRSSHVSHVLLTITSLIYKTELKTSIQRLFQIKN